MTIDPRPRLGALGEQLAAEHLVRRGFEIVERNYRTRWGELDIIAFDGRTLAFCEVKTRRASPAGAEPARRGQGAQARAGAQDGRALADRADRRPRADTLRFDAIGVIVDPAGRLLEPRAPRGCLP